MKKLGWLVVAASGSLAPASGAVSDNWPHWREPTHHGISHETNLPAEWGPSASPVLADGKVDATSEDGITMVVKAGPTFEVLAENDLESYTLSSPAISNGEIYLRTEDFLYVVGESAATEE